MAANVGMGGAGVVRDAGGRRMPESRSAVSPVRTCARPGCPAGAEATLRFAYSERQAVIEPLGDERRPQTYDLCGPHVARTRPPHGWTLMRSASAPAGSEHVSESSPGAIGGRDTVALLAAALNAAADDGARGATVPIVG